tara:strand:- start:257 stop:496 length:240 start_codon:yes stop_codon:yes gene_type:complete
MTVKIERNASPPDLRGLGKWQEIILEMDVGDAAIFEDDENLTSYHGLRRAAISLGFKVVMRTLNDGTIKVWKLEAEAAE